VQGPKSSKSLSKEDGRVVLELRSKYGNQSLSVFRQLLRERTGTVANKPSISNYWFRAVDCRKLAHVGQSTTRPVTTTATAADQPQASHCPQVPSKMTGSSAKHVS
jgi:hypothetical protein